MSKRIIKANQKVLHDSVEEKKRFHLYKSGKLWLVAGLATLSFATGGLSSQLMPQSVHADVATSTAATKTDDSTTSSAASSAAPSAAALKTSVATSSAVSSSATSVATSSTTSSATSSSASSEASSATTSEATSTASSSSSKASSASSSEATSKATSKAADQNSSAASSSATSKANSSSASKASSAATTKSSSKATSAATKSAAATTNSSAVKKAITSAKSSAASSQELKTKFHLDDVATVKQTGNQLVFSVAANKKLTDEQYQAIVDYATRNHLKVKGLSKQAQATHKTSAGTDLSDQFFAKHSTDKNAAHDGDSITLNGDVVTISLLTDVSHEHYLAHAETQKLYDYIKANNLKVVDQTLVEYNNYYDAEGNRVAAYNKRNVYRGDYATIEYRASDALIGLFYQAGKENSSFWRDAKWYPDLLGSDFGHWKATGGHDGEDKTLDADLGLMFSHTINGAAASDSFIIAGEFKDESTSFYIDNGDGTKLDLFNDKDDVTNTISWSRTGDLNSISNLPDHYAGEHIGYIFSADQVNEFIRAQAYAYEHEDDGATFNGQQFDGPEAGHHNAIIQPLNTTNKYQVNQIINIYDADGNLLYYVTELATGGEIIVNSDATMADLLNTADDVSAKGNYDITDVFDNFANGLNGDGTKGDGIKYRVNDGKTPSNDPKGTGIGAYSGNYADSLADGAPDIDYYMIEQADATITYVDEDKDGAQVGDPVKVSGDINTSKDVTIDIPEGYEYAGTNGVISADGETVTITLTDDDSDNVTILLKHHQIPVTPDDPSDPNYDATHTTSRETIHYVDENGNQAFPDNTDQTLDFVRTVIIDDVTNEVVGYGEWTPVSDSEFAAVTSPEKTGYTPDTPVVEGQKPEISTDEDGNEIVQANPEITVTYHANAETATVTYIDDDATDPNKNVVSTKTITGKMDGTKDVTITIPDGYEYVGTDGGKLSDDGKTVTITFTDNDSDDVTIHLKHHQTHVDPSDPRATKEVHETINYWNDESGKKIHASDTVAIDFSRTVLVDDITGEVTYGEWEADFGDTTFDGRDTYVIDGYFADIQHVDDITGVTPDTEDVTINVYYYATDQQVQPDDPKNDGEQIDPSNPNSPVFPAGVDESDLNKDVTETIHYVDENGNELADTYTKTVHYTRDAHVHYDADGNTTITYGDWVADGSFDAVNSPEIDGYVADQDVIAALDNPTDNVDIVVTYHHAEVAPTPAPEKPTPAPKPAPAPTKTVTPAHVAKKAMQQQAPAKRLPQTGEEDNSSMSEVGILGLLAGSLGLFGLGKKRKRDGED